MASGTVVCGPGMFPGSIERRPELPERAREGQHRAGDEPRRASGSVTSSAVRHSDRPSTNAARSRSALTLSIAARAGRTGEGAP